MMLRTRAILACAIAATIAAVPSVAAAQNAAVKAAIEANNKKFGDAVAAGNAAGVGGLFTDDAMVLPPNAEAVSGRPAIEKLFQMLIAAGVKGVTLTAQEVEAHGDAATEIGAYLDKGRHRQGNRPRQVHGPLRSGSRASGSCTGISGTAASPAAMPAK